MAILALRPPCGGIRRDVSRAEYICRDHLKISRVNILAKFDNSKFDRHPLPGPQCSMGDYENETVESYCGHGMPLAHANAISSVWTNMDEFFLLKSDRQLYRSF